MNAIVDTVYFATGISLAMAVFYCFTWATALAVGSELAASQWEGMATMTDGAMIGNIVLLSTTLFQR